MNEEKALTRARADIKGIAVGIERVCHCRYPSPRRGRGYLKEENRIQGPASGGAHLVPIKYDGDRGMIKVSTFRPS